MVRNALDLETSPYLRQHAGNPVDWLPWNAAALERARRENKPILLSIGYSACHWCHVMAHESFEDPATAAVMNELFVNIKVDREERPDLDRIYQLAHQMLTQRGGGWPLTMFLSPQDQQPFFGGTYFPKESRQGFPAFKDLLRRVAEFQRTRGEDLAQQSTALRSAFDNLQPAPAATHELNAEPFAAARRSLAEEFDGEYGGFGSAPKFPHPTYLTLLLRLWRASAAGDQPDLHALYMATLTLTRMAEGGLYDQVGGGFARYSVDRYWMIPHFEKMLYDNALLLASYSQAALATGDPLFRRIANETADWLLRDMRSPHGGFWSTLDADSEGHEGKFYTWDAAQVRAVLPEDQWRTLEQRFGLDTPPNFEGAWHLHVQRSMEAVAQSCAASLQQAEQRVDAARQELLRIRNARTWPGRDEKILTAWNGLAVSGMAVAARTLQRKDLADAAARAVDFVRTRLWRDGRLLAVHTAGQSRFAAYLDDYAFMLDGVLELLQTHWRTEDLQFAVALADSLLEHFADARGGFFFTADDHEVLIHRSKSFADEAIPAGNGVAAQTLARLGWLLGETRYLEAAEHALRAAWPMIERHPHAHASMLVALEEYLQPPTVIVIRGEHGQVEQWRDDLSALYAPRRLVFGIPDDATALPPALAHKKSLQAVTAYICRGMTCSEPVRSLESLLALTRE